MPASRPIFVFLSSFALIACSKDDRAEAARRVARDEAQLKAIVDLDLEAEHALANVGEAEKKQNDDEAATLLDTSVLPATRSAITRAEGTPLETEWGRARRDEMLAAMKDRQDELPRYAAALRSHDFEAQLASVQKQMAIEKRAMQAAEAIQSGPDSGVR